MSDVVAGDATTTFGTMTMPTLG